MLNFKRAGFPAAMILVMASSMVASRAYAQMRTGRQSASATSKVTLSFPSVLGVNVLAALSRRGSSSGVVFASRNNREPADALSLQIFGNSADGTVQVVRTLRRSVPGPFGLASSGRNAPDPPEVRSSSHQGARGWTLVRDRIEAAAPSFVASGQAKTTVVYELWDF